MKRIFTMLIWALLCVGAMANPTSTTTASQGPACENPLEVIHFSLDACEAIAGVNDHDYSEFTASYPMGSDCANFEVLGGHLYRENPYLSKHSCTPGFDSLAMCISSADTCTFTPEHSRTLYFDVRVSPENGQVASLSGLEFYEKAPEIFEWVNGASDDNNYPTLYGLRVLANGQEVFLQEDIPTTTDWTLECFDFSDNPAFSVTETTDFQFQLLGYCLAENWGKATAWDIDEITVLSCCDFCLVEGGSIETEDPLSVCTGDGEPDLVDVNLGGDFGDFSAWVITDENKQILAVPSEPPFDFEGAGGGTCLIYHISYSSLFTQLEPGVDLDTIEGCFDLSNAIAVERTEILGGEISTEDNTFICSGDETEDIINVSLEGNNGDNNAWVITDGIGNILIFDAQAPFDFEEAGVGICQIWHVSWFGTLEGGTFGAHIDDLVGCHALSNPIEVVREEVASGEISTEDPTEFCVTDGVADLVDVDVLFNLGENFAWIITNAFGGVIAFDAVPPFDFEGAGDGVCFIYHLAYQDEVGDLSGLENIDDLEGCFSLSDPIRVIRNGVTPAEISSDIAEVCIGGNETDIVTVTASNFEGDNNTFLVVDENQEILDIQSSNLFDVSNYDAEECSIIHLVYIEIEGLTLGNTLSDLSGCFALSNVLTIEKLLVEGGELSSPQSEICIGDGSEGTVSVSLMGQEGSESAWVITDEDGTILGLPASPPFDLSGAGPGTCLIWHLSYESIIGLEAGANAGDLAGCFDLSNPVAIVRNCVAPGQLIPATDTTICDLGQTMSITMTVDGQKGDEGHWTLLNEEGLIIQIQETGQFTIPSNSQDQSFEIVHISNTEGIIGLTEGENIDDLVGCYVLSEPRVVDIEYVDGGEVVALSPTDICLGDANEQDLVNFSVSNTFGETSQWVITDDNGNILGLPVVPPFDFSDAGAGVCLVWHLSYNDEIEGLAVGNNASQLAGCFDLSNPVSVTRNCVDGGSISSNDPLFYCLDGSEYTIQTNTSGAKGDNQRLVLTNDEGDIILVSNTDSFILPEDELNYTVWNISYTDGLSGLLEGENVSDLEGCFDLSNGITFSYLEVDGGQISTPGPTVLCLGDDDESDIVDFSVSENVGSESAWIVTDENGIILGLPASTPIDFSGAGDGICLVWHISYEGILGGVEIGADANDIVGCFDLSDPIAIERQCVDPGSLSGPELIYCETGEGIIIDVALEGAKGNTNFVVTEITGEIIAIYDDLPVIIPTTGSGTNFDIWNVSFTDLDGLEVGGDLEDLEGCYAVSDPFTVTRECVEGGFLSTNDNTDICFNGTPNFVTVNVEEAKGENQRYLVTDPTGEIIVISSSNTFDINALGNDPVYQIWSISYNELPSGFSLGSSAADLSGCFELSNPITIIIEAPDGGVLSLEDGSEEITICTGDCISDVFDVNLSGAQGPEMSWFITNGDGVILELPDSPPFDFEGTDPGTCLVGHVSYYDIENLEVGGSLFDLEGCYDLSNLIIVNRVEAEGEGESFVYFNFNDCNADTQENEHCDYSEFTPIISNMEDCASFEVSSNVVFRNDPQNFKHSCTPGIQETPAICVSSLNSCSFQNDSDYALRFSVVVTPGISGVAHISELSFFERAPEQFEWLNGATGNNNYPTLYGIRVLANGTEVYKQTGIETGPDYSLEIFDFSDVPAFTVDEVTEFSFELLGYCLIGSLAQATAWDIDELELVASCSNKMSAGQVSLIDGSESTTVCVDDGTSDILVFESTNESSDYAFVVTDDSNIVLGVLPDNTLDVEGADAGFCRVWGVAYIGTLDIEVGDDLSSSSLAIGCSALSANYVEIERLTGDDCGDGAGPGEEDPEVGIKQGKLLYTLMPNPANDYIIVDLQEIPGDYCEISVVDIHGKVLHAVSAKKTDPRKITIPLTDLAAGNYIVKFSSGKVYQTSKITKVQ